MSTTDERLASARTDITNAIASIGDVVVDEAWGYEFLEPEFVQELRTILIQLMEIKDKLR